MSDVARGGFVSHDSTPFAWMSLTICLSTRATWIKLHLQGSRADGSVRVVCGVELPVFVV